MYNKSIMNIDERETPGYLTRNKCEIAKGHREPISNYVLSFVRLALGTKYRSGSHYFLPSCSSISLRFRECALRYV